MDEVHFQQYGSRCRMWIPPEVKDPVLQHHPTRKSVGYFGAVRLRDGKFIYVPVYSWLPDDGHQSDTAPSTDTASGSVPNGDRKETNQPQFRVSSGKGNLRTFVGLTPNQE